MARQGPLAEWIWQLVLQARSCSGECNIGFLDDAADTVML